MTFSTPSANRRDLHAEFVPENARIGEERLFAVEGVDVGAAHADAAHAHPRLARCQGAGVFGGREAQASGFFEPDGFQRIGSVVFGPSGGPGDVVYRLRGSPAPQRAGIPGRGFVRSRGCFAGCAWGWPCRRCASGYRGWPRRIAGQACPGRSAVFPAVTRRLGTFRAHGLRRGMPVRRAVVAEQAHCQRGRVENGHALLAPNTAAGRRAPCR